jgi:hypothetical protein
MATGRSRLAGKEMIKRRWNEFWRGGTWRRGGVEPGVRCGVAENGQGGGAFVVPERRRRGGEMGGQAVAGGASSKHWLWKRR